MSFLVCFDICVRRTDSQDLVDFKLIRRTSNSLAQYIILIFVDVIMICDTDAPPAGTDETRFHGKDPAAQQNTSTS